MTSFTIDIREPLALAPDLKTSLEAKKFNSNGCLKTNFIWEFSLPPAALFAGFDQMHVIFRA